MTTEAITPVVPPLVAATEEQPQSAGTEAVAAINSAEVSLPLSLCRSPQRFGVGDILFVHHGH